MSVRIKDEDFVGKKYGRLTVVAIELRLCGRQRASFAKCRCSCGAAAVVLLQNLKSGATKSCGCLRTCSNKKRSTHGKSRTVIYKTWLGMIDRCNNKKNPNYKHYGGRGISVSSRWMSFPNFYKDMGDVPADRSLDRIDNDGDYGPTNCRWASEKDQHRNKRSTRWITYEGKRKSMAQWAEDLGVNYSAMQKRLQKMSVKESFELKKNSRRK